ncbi:MAG: PilN domain-containing protein [Oligoflexales bacterium]|nr:PilN domain-containing protein [Oligoflexales bacterium]
MIKINLTPIAELENRIWWLLEVAALLLSFAGATFGFEKYIEMRRNEIIEISQQTAEIRESINRINPQVEKYKNLERDLSQLNTKLNAIKDITLSLPERFRIIISLEHIHNLKPEGVWLRGIAFDQGSDDSIVIEGGAFDNLLISEFMASLKSTNMTALDSVDIRSQVAFEKISIEQSLLVEKDTLFEDLTEIYSFKISLKIKLKELMNSESQTISKLFQSQTIEEKLR